MDKEKQQGHKPERMAVSLLVEGRYRAEARSVRKLTAKRRPIRKWQILHQLLFSAHLSEYQEQVPFQAHDWLVKRRWQAKEKKPAQ